MTKVEQITKYRMKWLKKIFRMLKLLRITKENIYLKNDKYG